ncbi:MAG: Histidinol-phosphate aminotransferase [uncultured Thermomicrobiales bacterium]|uniref:Histidinol-phosphate aminotransferase n=1 Tax=uncultured Thermomicrobiales bacterium TaxID=1645740 RepID=A0A6J4UQ15_9BACT|nr:MAG: Histidinol-phosphate aminotransferase [uncultured Thermomicrobiales bacterium]
MTDHTPILTPRLRLTPLTPGDADAMHPVLADPALYAFTGGDPPTLPELRDRYLRLAPGWSPNREQRWLNWIVRRLHDDRAIGFVQATLTGDRAAVAWVIGVPWQGRGYAGEAASALVAWLRSRSVVAIEAHVHPDHGASAGVAAGSGLVLTGETVDGEQVWRAVMPTDGRVDPVPVLPIRYNDPHRPLSAPRRRPGATPLSPTVAAPATTVDLEALVRPVVRAIPPYLPATIETGTTPPPHNIKLDMNESPYGPSPKVRAALANFDQTHRYPDFAASELRTAIAAYCGAPVDRIVAGAGLDDVLNNLGTLLIDAGDEVIVSEPTFGVYRALFALHGARIVDVPISAQPGFALDAGEILGAVGPRTKLVVVCNPNNPTGNLFDADAIERVIAEAPCLVAVDEAYAEFAGTTMVPLMERYPNLAILRTLSKFAGLAGLRVGYGIFPEPLMPHLWRVSPAFCNVSAASTAAAVAALDDLPYLNGLVAGITRDRDALAASLRELPGVEPYPSATNFLLVRLPVPDAGPVVAALAARGVHVRHFANPVLGIADCLRVSIGTTEENEIFLAELAAVLGSGMAERLV